MLQQAIYDYGKSKRTFNNLLFQTCIKAKKAKLVERIKKETNPEKIEQCLEILGEDLEYNEAYFESLINDVSLKDAPMPGIVTSDEELDNRIKASEASGLVDDAEVNAFFKWMLSK